MEIKNLIRSSLNLLHLDLTKNLEYDRLTKAIMKKILKPDSCCIDVGCHRGEILDIMLRLAPKGKHYAIEPIPSLFEQLCQNYKGKAEIFSFALSESAGTTTFQFVKNAPAYSGIRKRSYAVSKPEIEEIQVELNTLDKIIPAGQQIDFIKIDVEGGEFGVLKGGRQLLSKYKPVVIFECGLGASDYYGTKPKDLYHFVTSETGLRISTLKSFIGHGDILSVEQFETCFNTNSEYYFVAHN